MRLLESTDNDCVYASVAMLINRHIEYVKTAFKPQGELYPFPEPYNHFKRVPSIDEICLELLRQDPPIYLTPFVRELEVAPDKDCPRLKVWDVEFMELIMLKGKGLIEGVVTTNKRDIGHMVAWDGQNIFDPRGYCYSANVADRFDFRLERFWLSS